MLRTYARARVSLAAAAGAAAVLLLTATPALADHTNPATPLASLTPAFPGTPLVKNGDWTFVKNFPPNPGTDLKFFERDGAIYGVSGSLGQGPAQYAGQRIVRLTDATGTVAPEWVADHGSARCTPSRGVTGLQHDQVLTPADDPELLVDTADAADRCHDPLTGGLEIVDISGVAREDGAPVRELHLVRLDGTSHTATGDPNRPWIVYSSNSDQGRPWIDVVDISACLGLTGDLTAKREACTVDVFRIPFDDKWTSQVDPADGQVKNPHGCHDITAEGNRLYCAAINGTLILDVANLTDTDGAVRGTPLTCSLVAGTSTAAKVSDCRVTAAQWNEAGKPSATGWSYVGHFNHPGRDATNGQTRVPSNEGVSISHESDPTPDGKFLFVTDERGGGIVPPGASCAPGPGNPIGNGGMHVFDISNPAQPKYAMTPEGKKAVFISSNVLPMPTFCNIHVIQHVPDEARVIAAWYSQGIKVIDYFIDQNGHWTFKEVAALVLPGAATWTAEAFKMVDNADGTRTYHLMASDIGRGIDVVTLKAPKHPLSAARITTNPASGPGGGEVLARGSADDLPATGTSVPAGALAAVLATALVARVLLRRTGRTAAS